MKLAVFNAAPDDEVAAAIVRMIVRTGGKVVDQSEATVYVIGNGHFIWLKTIKADDILYTRDCCPTTDVKSKHPWLRAIEPYLKRRSENRQLKQRLKRWLRS